MSRLRENRPVHLQRLLAWLVAGAGAAATALAPAAGLAATIAADGARIVEVTVFPDRAEVVREVDVQLPAGASTIELAGLPFGVEGDSLRVTARGVPATLGAVELRERAETPGETPEHAAARREVERLDGEIAAIDAEQATAKEVRDFIGSIRAATGKRESEKAVEGKLDPAALDATIQVIRTSLTTLDREALARSEKRRTLDRDLAVARARLGALRPPKEIRSRVAAVEVEAERAGSLRLRLAYLAPGASWRPSYRASLDAATGEVSLASEAVVRQRTGEDWSGVALRLSTAAPARGVAPPELSSLILRPREPEMRASAVGGALAKAEPEAGFADALRVQEVTADLPSTPVPVDAAAIKASIVRSAYNVAFEVPGRSDVPADGSDHRVVLRQETLASEVAYRAVPALGQAAFLVAKTKAPAAYPLLAGPVRVFAGGAYLGAFALPETGPGSELSLPFGVDNRIEVERTRLPEDHSTSGVFGKERRIGYAFRNTVENLRDAKVTVTVEDRIPVSEDERIEVESGKDMTAGHREDPKRPGVLLWTFDLVPGEKREILVEYVVRFPVDLVVPPAE